MSEGHDMDHYASDASAVVERLDLRNAVRQPSTGGAGRQIRCEVRPASGAGGQSGTGQRRSSADGKIRR